MREEEWMIGMGDSICTPAKLERREKAVRCTGSTNLEQLRTTGYGCNTLFTNSGNYTSEGFGSEAGGTVFSGLLKDECRNGSLENVFRSSDTNCSPCSECCEIIQSFPSKREQHAVIPAIRAEGQVNELLESMVMANGSSSNQTTDRTCTDVEKILHNELYRKPFQQFLEQQFCAENINFYMAVEDYRSIPDSDLEKRAEVGRQIFERYFAPNGIEPVNIDNSTSKSIRDAVMSEDFTPQLYDVAQYQIFHLLKYDCWPRYLRAGGVAPTFDDDPDETSGTSTTGGSTFRSISSGAPPPSTSSSRVAEVCTKFCTLMLNDAPCVEQIALHDPTESVGKWTATVAAQHGMDPGATEVVDAQSGATIDPARQAVDALNNRCVRLLPVLLFAAEIMIPNAPNKTGTSTTNSRIVLLRARHGLSLNVVLRPVLAKYLIDYDSCVVVLPSSFDAVSWQTTVGTIRQRFVLVMTQQKYQERRHSPKREIAKEFHSTQFSTPAMNLPFYQHGDVAFVELPADFDLRTGKMNATRSYCNAKTDHTSGLLKFVRKASQAVTNREPSSSDTTGLSSSSHQYHAGSLQQQRKQHSGGHNNSQLAPSSYTDEIRRKSLGTFQRMPSAAMADIPYCGEDTAVENLRLPQNTRSTGSTKQSKREHIDGREKVFEIPEFLRKEITPEMRNTEKKLTLIDSNAPKIPSLYTSTVSSDKDFSPGDRKGSLGWQHADYV
ncbi:hypothetical protein, variant [Loa loa]|uniref:RGS domain-containing protein n=1 Tax=Loa loa TaxID=7209 RepID=A0A1S0UE80_LOALO|nr:hypothetical protein, variant [Loa loa]EJD73863.1 hypothetical protein, variant [Loa loa]